MVVMLVMITMVVVATVMVMVDVDGVDKVQPQLAPLHRREPQLLRLPSQGSCLPPSTGPAGGLGSLFFLQLFEFLNPSSSPIHWACMQESFSDVPIFE